MKRSFSLLNLVFFIPAIILSFVVWNEYTSGLDANMKKTASSGRGLFFLDRGSKVMGIAEDDSAGLKGELYDAKTEKLIKGIPLYSDIHKQFVSAYQNGRLILVTKNNENRLVMNMIDSEGGVKELAQGKPDLSGILDLFGFLDSSAYTWRGKLVIFGESTGKIPYIAQIDQGKLQTINLNHKNLLPSRPTHARPVQESFDSGAALPMLEVDLHDDRRAFVSGVLNQQGLPLTYIKKEEENYSEARDRAARQFASQFHRNETRLLKVDGKYPGQVRVYDAAADKWGGVLPTPMPVYQAKLYSLNDEETLIAGSNTKDEAEGHVLGYLYNEKTKQFTDVSAIVSLIPYDDLKNAKLLFYKEAGDDILYYSNSTASAAWMNMHDGAFGLINSGTFQQWQLGRDENQKSIQSFMNYLKQGDAVVINWAIWVFIPVFMFGLLAILPPILRAKHKRKLEQGRQGLNIEQGKRHR
ncbi:hypothetical protein [Paenibacillus sp. GCM10027626]|uniref:hypothetical protein n=1 Tax=Paenibacillus sp. GCM10027626 TaxID=3273411 RepID=UPI003629F936